MDEKQPDGPSAEVQEIMRTLVSAIRAVKLYPPNNPIYAQSLKKAFDVLDHFLSTSPDFIIGVHKTGFAYQHHPLGKDGQLNRPIVQDLFSKGIREITLSRGLTETELLEFCRILALPAEDIAIRSGIPSILWEKGVAHIKIAEAGLDAVVTSEEQPSADAAAAEKEGKAPDRTLALDDLLSDPAGFAHAMLERAERTRVAHESVEERLFTLYQETGREIQERRPEQAAALFEGLAASALALESPFREGLIGGLLYGALDADLIKKQTEMEEHLPSALQEIQTGRFSQSWTAPQVATLLQQTASAEARPAPAMPSPPSFEATLLPPDLTGIAKEMAEYSPGETAELQAMSEAGMEPDIVRSAARTLLFMMPLVKDSRRVAPDAEGSAVLSGMMRQLEDLVSYCLARKDYEEAGFIVAALAGPVDEAYRPYVAGILEKASAEPVLTEAIELLQKHPRESPEYRSAYAYLSLFKGEALDMLLRSLAEEQDRTARFILLDLVKDFGRDQTALLGRQLADGRWQFVRSIVSVLGEGRSDQAVPFLRKAADHEHISVRQETVKALAAIGGKKAAAVLAHLFNDRNRELSRTALRAFGELAGIGAGESVLLTKFLEDRQLRQKDQDLALEAVKALGKIGGPDAEAFLERYTHIRWWKARKPQEELRDAADRSREEIKRRMSHGGRKQG